MSHRLDLLKLQLSASLIRSMTTQTVDHKWKTEDFGSGITKLDWFKSIGWGFKDTEFVLDGKTE